MKYSQALTQLNRFISSKSHTIDTKVGETIAYASQRLIDSGHWKNNLFLTTLTPDASNIITLPEDAKSIVKIKKVPQGCRRDIPLQNIFANITSPTCDCTNTIRPIAPGKYQLSGTGTTPPLEYLALVVRQFVPLTDPDQEVYPDNPLALRYAVQAVNYDDKNDAERARVYWDQAFAVLEAEQEQIILGEEKSLQVKALIPRIVNIV